MESISSFQHFNPSPLFRQPIITKKHHRNFPTNFSLLDVAETIPETPLSACDDPFPLKSLHTLSPFDELNEFSSLNLVKAMHAQVLKLPKKHDTQRKIQYLITLYLELGDFWLAASVFFVGFAENYLYWNDFVEEFKSYGETPHEILVVFVDLHNKGLIFDTKIVSLVLKICATLGDKWLGLELHACLIKRGFDLDAYCRCALMNFYGRCWDIDSANQVLNDMPYHESLLWNEAILVQLRNERWLEGLRIFCDMQLKCSSSKANSFTIAKVLQACGKLGYLDGGRQIHGYAIRNALESNTLVCNSLISMYSKSNDLKHARSVFDSMENRNLSSWNSIISSYAALGYLNDAWKLFNEMENFDIKPDIITWNCLMSGHIFNGSYLEVLKTLQKMQAAGYKPNAGSVTSALQAVSELGYLNLGKEVHCYAIRNGLDHDLHLGTSLVDMYVKNDDLTNAKAVFENMKNRNIFAWNSLISGYSFKGRFEEALNLVNQMKEEGIRLDLVTYNGLVSGYATSGCIKEALSMIRQIKISGLTPNVVSWTALISGCSQKGHYKEALEFAIQMQQECIKPNSATIASLLRACTGLSLLQKGNEIHCLSIRNGFMEDVYVTTALIDMYSKCGSLKNAYKVFQKVENKTLAAWNSMIMGFAIYSLGREAISLFDKMLGKCIQPDSITLTALLSSCKNSALINEGWKYFDGMKSDHGINPTIEHYSCMVDLLGRAGYLDEAWDFIQTMPLEPDATVWGAFLASCRIHGNLELGEKASERLFELEPYNASNYVLMMHLYAAANRWEDVDRIREMMAVKGVKIGHVWSWIQINQKVHVFSAVGKPHLDEGEIYFELYKLISEMKSVGYLPDTKCVYQNIDVEEKEKILLAHTEKLAITYGLIKTKRNAPIRVINNTRVCSDCHSVAKYISLLRKRDIFLKDGVRFHHFQDGKCSCNDLW